MENYLGIAYWLLFASIAGVVVSGGCLVFSGYVMNRPLPAIQHEGAVDLALRAHLLLRLNEPETTMRKKIWRSRKRVVMIFATGAAVLGLLQCDVAVIYRSPSSVSSLEGVDHSDGVIGSGTLETPFSGVVTTKGF